MTINQRIEALRNKLTEYELDAFIIPSTDPHMGEYVPDHWAERAWISGFTGSAGTAVITKDFAGLWTDSRYFIQAKQQLSNSVMELVELKIPHTPEHIDWLVENLNKNARVGINGNMVSSSMVQYMKEKFAISDITLHDNLNPIEQIWIDRPPLPDNTIFEHATKYAGKSRHTKLCELRDLMLKDNVSHHLICGLDEIAWLLNLRGTDVQFNPLFVSYLLVDQEKAILYISRQKITSAVFKKLEQGNIMVHAYGAIFRDLEKLSPEVILKIDAAKTNQAIVNSIPKNIKIKDGMGYVTSMKAIKNETEIDGLRNVMIKDGVAWVKFLHWLETNIGDEQINEFTAASKLDEFRAEEENYMGPSFHPISSFGANGAIVHYAVSKETAADLKPEGIYLCDTGGQYLDGTTDTTRTISLGSPTTLQRMDFTLALKGTIAISMLRFPVGTKGYQIDVLARKALWDYGLNFGHGTGHGVGFFLNVHEGPQTIGTGASGNMQTAFTPGMVTTVEPAIYRDGSYGMRTENMTLCVPDISSEYGDFLCFETLTLAPIDISLIEISLMTHEEIHWLNTYHLTVRERLTPYLNTAQKYWLYEKTREIENEFAN